jgi:hypothetical protein
MVRAIAVQCETVARIDRPFISPEMGTQASQNTHQHLVSPCRFSRRDRARQMSAQAGVWLQTERQFAGDNTDTLVKVSVCSPPEIGALSAAANALASAASLTEERDE